MSSPDLRAGREESGAPAATPGRRALGRYEVYGKKGVWIIAEQGGPVVGAFYRPEDSPGWWRGHCHGRVRKLYGPDAEPLNVAERFLYR